MKEKQIGSGIGAGGISILAIFVVLCLATLAALYIGCRLWGIAGMIAAPMITVALLQLRRAPGE